MIFKTPKGTELPILDLKGKDYLMVAHRIVWFREERPEWSIETEAKVLNENYAIFQATVKNEHGRIMAQAHKREDQKHFPDFMEKAETSSIGRCLALCGFGTQFCSDEFEEGNRLAESPLDKSPSTHKISNVTFDAKNITPIRKAATNDLSCTSCGKKLVKSKFSKDESVDEFYCSNYKNSEGCKSNKVVVGKTEDMGNIGF